LQSRGSLTTKNHSRVKAVRRAVAVVLLFTLPLRPSTAGPAALGSEEVELINPWGDTLADASTQAQSYAQNCRKPDNACRPTPLSQNQLVPPFDGCSNNVTPIIAWRQADDLKDVDRFVADLERQSATHDLFDCSGTTCLVVVPTIAIGEKESGVSTLSVCRVQIVLGVPGPPSRCQEVLKRAKRGGVLLRGQVGESFTGCRIGLRDFDAVFEGGASDLRSVRNLVGEALRASPFDLSVMEDGNAVVGTRAQMPSAILAGWREWVTVRAEIDARGSDAGTAIITTILVSKQATAGREAWTPASEPQEEAYLRALRNEFQRRGGVLSTGVGR
jgi:hypothetical protein